MHVILKEEQDDREDSINLIIEKEKRRERENSITSPAASALRGNASYL